MPFQFIPINATRIDVSAIKDVERERLKITFERGETLYFGVDLRNGPQHPRLLLDVSDRNGSELGTNKEIHKEFARQFYRERVKRSWARRVIDQLHRLVDSSFCAQFTGWQYSHVFDKLEIELPIGNEYQACELMEGRALELRFGTYFSTQLEEYVPWTWGDVVSIEDITLLPISLVPALGS